MSRFNVFGRIAVRNVTPNTIISRERFGTRIQLEKQHHHLNKNVVVNEINYKKLSNIVLDEMVVYGYRKSII